jgi:hypothetical protein
LERDGDTDVPFGFLTVSTVDEPDVIYDALGCARRARSREILDRTLEDHG